MPEPCRSPHCRLVSQRPRAAPGHRPRLAEMWHGPLGLATSLPDRVVVVKFVVNEGLEHRHSPVTWDDVGWWTINLLITGQEVPRAERPAMPST